MNAFCGTPRCTPPRTPTPAPTPPASASSTWPRLLVEEMKELGIQDAAVDEHCYVYGTIPATPGYANQPALGLIAHMDYRGRRPRRERQAGAPRKL